MKKIKSICIIDDDPITVFGIKKILKSVIECDNVSSYKNGKEAIDGIRAKFEENNELPEIIFLDINMPIMDGWQFLEEFITIPMDQKVRVNIVTSSIDPLDKQKSDYFKQQTHHHIDFNNKPIKKDEISQITTTA